jgi:hypothetical protein
VVTRGPRAFTVRVLKPDYSGVLGSVPEYQTVSTTWQHLGIGTATVVAPEEGVLTAALTAYRQPIPVRLTAPGLPPWTGRVAAVSSTKESNAAGQLQVTLVDENKMLQKILLAPVPTSPWATQTAATHDKRTGPLATVAKAYLQANLDRLAAEGNPLRMQVVPTIGTDTSPTVTVRARAKTFDEVFSDLLRLHGYDARVEVWLPSDPMPNGMELTGATMLVDVVASRDQRYVKFADDRGGVRSRVATASHPGAMAAVIGGPGEDTARIFQKVMANDGRVAANGAWGYPEEWQDATDADEAGTRTSRGLERLGEMAGMTSVSLEINDGAPWRAGPDKDYWIGDRVRAEFSDVEIVDRIDRVTVTDSPTGYEVVAAFGSARDTETSDVRVARKVGALVQRIQRIETER